MAAPLSSRTVPLRPAPLCAAAGWLAPAINITKQNIRTRINVVRCMWVSPENYYTDQQPLRLAGRTAKSQLVQPNASHPTTDDPRLSRTKFAHFLLRRRGCPVAWSRTDPDKGTLLSKDVRFILDGPIKNGRFARCIQMYPAVNTIGGSHVDFV